MATKKEESKKLDWERISFGIITSAGGAKSSAMEGLHAAKAGKFDEAKKKLAEANKEIGEASHMHFDVIQKEAQGEQLEFKVLFLHAEDQLLTTQTLILMVEEMIDMWKAIKGKK